MSVTYTKSIITDFNNNINTSKLANEIVNQGFIPTLLTINTLGDAVYIIFNMSLSVGEQTVLNTVISNHTGVNIVYETISKISLKNDIISTTSYIRVGTFIYPGSNHMTNISKITGIGYMESGVTNYSIRIYDKTNNLTIVENTFTNINEDILNLGLISNIPTEESVIEISVKKTGGNGNNKAYVDNITIYYK